MGHVKRVIKAAEPGGACADNFVRENAEHFLGQRVLFNSVVIKQACLSAPTDMQSGVNVGFGPLHNLTQFVPVVHIRKIQIFYWSAGDNHAVIAAVLYLGKGAVKGAQMVLVNVLRRIAGSLQQFYLNLKRRVGEFSQELGHDFGRHQIEDDQL